MIELLNDEDAFRFADLSSLLSERHRAIRYLHEFCADDPPPELKAIVVKFYDAKVIEAIKNILKSNGFAFVENK